MAHVSYPASAIWKSGCSAFLLLAVSMTALAGHRHGRQFGDIEVVNSTTPPSPEGVSIDRGRIYVTGPAVFGTAGTGPSKMFVYNWRSGNLEAEVSVEGENLEYEHTLGGNAVDAKGRIYALTTATFAPEFAQLGMVRYTKRGFRYQQDFYTPPFPTLPSCAFGPVDTSCALPNDFAFAPDGSAYVTDSFQSVIWRVPPGGGAPEVWQLSPRFAGIQNQPIGLNGIRLDPSRRYVYVAVSGPSTILRIPLKEYPTEEDIELFHQYPAGAGPDGIVFGASGKLYVSLAGDSEISVLGRDGSEVARIAGSPDDPIPLNGPANMAFDDPSRSLLVTNHGGDFALLRIFVNDRGDPLEKPGEFDRDHKPWGHWPHDHRYGPRDHKPGRHDAYEWWSRYRYRGR